MVQRYRVWLWVAVALAIGLLIAWVDSRPTWDDAGVTAGAIFLVAAVFGVAHPARAWLWALALGGWVPVFGIALHNNYASLLALGFALAGAYVGAIGRKVIHVLGSKETPDPPPT